jgi:DNA modification methylase
MNTRIIEGEGLAGFLAEHAKPYDAATDDYERPAFAADIKEGKNDPIYNAHSYHTKVPPRSIIPYILHYTKPGDVVLDLFCGSGMTGVAAQSCANPPSDILESFPELKDRVGPRACILNDLSPAACHIAYNYNTPVNVEALKREFDRIKEAVTEEFAWLYGTQHYEPAAGLYDLNNVDVLRRLKNSPGGAPKHDLLEETERTWELLTKTEVEERLGYSVTKLPRDEKWGDLDVGLITQWICIPATIQYTIWSDVYRCEGFVTIEEPTGRVSTRGKNTGNPIVAKKRVSRGCGDEMVLWDVAVDFNTGEVREVFDCPHCGQPWKKPQLTKARSQVTVTSYEFTTVGSKSKRRERKTTNVERRLIATVEGTPIPYWYPQDEWKETREMWRGGHRDSGITRVSDFYTKRNLRAVARLWSESEKVEDSRLRAMLRFAITAFVIRASRLSRIAMSNFVHGGGGPVMSALLGTLYVPSFSVESNVGLLFERRQVDLEQIGHYLDTVSNAPVVVQLGSASKLSQIPDNSIDFVFTDPPFGSNIFYSDCSILWESWLAKFTDMSLEAVWNKSVKSDEGGKSLADYAQLMGAAFSEMFRVLKPGRWATVEFNNSDGKVFDAIKTGVMEAGFEIANMLLLDKAQKSFKQVKGEKGEEDVVDKDVLFNLHKPAAARAEVQAEDRDVEQQVAEAVRQHLATLPERIAVEPAKYSDDHRTTSTINSMLMNTLIPRGVSVERLNLPFIERVCSRYFRKVGLRWYLRGEAVGGNGGGLVQEEVAIKDEMSAIAWLRQKVEVRPVLIGEIKPHWMKATGLLPAHISQSLILENLLTENFWRDADSNRWREPTAEERERMNDDRSLRVLHDAERFVNGTFQRTTDDAERAEWIDVLFQACRAVEDGAEDALPALRGFDAAEAYQLITRLFQSILRDHLSPEQWRKVEKQAQAASRKLTTQAVTQEKQNPKAGGKSGELELDFGK